MCEHLSSEQIKVILEILTDKHHDLLDEMLHTKFQTGDPSIEHYQSSIKQIQNIIDYFKSL